jgi:hypothetical protein
LRIPCCLAEEEELFVVVALGVTKGALKEAAALALRVAEPGLALDEQGAPEAVLLLQVRLALAGTGQVGENAAGLAPFRAEAEGGDFDLGAVGQGVAGHGRGVIA